MSAPISNNTRLNDGHKIPNIGFGTGSALFGQEVKTQVVNALNAGFRHLDTAQAYRNEESVGKGLREWLNASENQKATTWIEKGFVSDERRRRDAWITTKYVGTPQGPYSELEASLKRLGLEYVDLYLIHHPRAANGDFKGTWKEYERAKKDGLARSIGVSNFSDTELGHLIDADIVPAVNQIRLHPYNLVQQQPVLDFALKHQIVIEAYGSLYPLTRDPNGPVTTALEAPSKRLNATPAQVLFLWVRAKGAVVVTTTSKQDRLKEYLALESLGPLLPEEIAAIDAAGRVLPLSGSANTESASQDAWNSLRKKGSWLLLGLGIAGFFWLGALSSLPR